MFLFIQKDRKMKQIWAGSKFIWQKRFLPPKQFYVQFWIFKRFTSCCLKGDSESNSPPYNKDFSNWKTTQQALENKVGCSLFVLREHQPMITVTENATQMPAVRKEFES